MNIYYNIYSSVRFCLNPGMLFSLLLMMCCAPAIGQLAAIDDSSLPKEMVGPITIDQLEIAEELKEATVLFVLLENPCPGCNNKELRKREDLDLAEKMISSKYDKTIKELNKIFKSFKGKYKVIYPRDLDNASYADSTKYPFVYYMHDCKYLLGTRFDTSGGSSTSHDFESTWVLLDRRTNVGYNIIRSRLDSGSFFTTPRLGVKQFNKVFK